MKVGCLLDEPQTSIVGDHARELTDKAPVVHCWGFFCFKSQRGFRGSNGSMDDHLNENELSLHSKWRFVV